MSNKLFIAIATGMLYLGAPLAQAASTVPMGNLKMIEQKGALVADANYHHHGHHFHGHHFHGHHFHGHHFHGHHFHGHHFHGHHFHGHHHHFFNAPAARS